MSKKRSYLDHRNIIKEGILDKIFALIKRGKINRLRKKFRKQPEVRKSIESLASWEKSLDARLRKQGINPDDWMDHL